MVNSIDDMIELHKKSGNIEDAYIKVHLDDKILNFNIFTLKFTAVDASKYDVDIWNNRIEQEIRKNKTLEKEIKEFISLFELFNKLKIRSGNLEKRERPDFLLNRNGKMIGIEITKIYVGYDWLLERLSREIKEYHLADIDVEGYIEHKKASDKIEISSEKGKIFLSPKIFSATNEEYEIKIKNKIFEKIRKQLDEYEKYDINIIYADITSPEYFDDITDLDAFSKEILYYISHLEENLDILEYRLIIKINNKWIEINLNNGSYKIL